MRQRAYWSLLLAFVVFIFTTPLSHARISFLVAVSPPYDYCRCTLDPELELDKGTLQEAAISAKSHASKKVLARIGAPFIVSTDNPDQMQCLLDVLLFCDVQKGTCPFPNGSLFHSLLQICFPEELRRRYGADRLKLLEHVALPDAWRVSEDTLALESELEAAEDFIAALPSVNPPPMILIRLPASTGEGGVPPRSFLISLTDISVTEGPSNDLKWIHFDYTGPHKRFLRQRGIQNKRLCNSTVGICGAMAPNEPREPKQELVQETTASLLSNSLIQNLEARLEFSEPFFHQQRHDTRKRTKMESLTCMKLIRAWRTLREQSVISSDTRLVQLRRLLERHHCIHDENVEGEDDIVIEERAAETCENFCQALHETRAWGRRSGQSLTIAQSFAIFFSLFAENFMTKVQPSGSSAKWWSFRTSQQSDNFNSDDFLKRTIDFIHRQSYQRCACNVSRAEKGEFLYLAALLQLVQAPSDANTPLPTHATEEYHSLPIARVVLNLYQAMWYESPHATAALATLREHGIFTSQHQKASLPLLLLSIRGRSSFIFRQLFLHRKLSEGSSTHKGNSGRGFNKDSLAELLLRKERFYAVLNNFGNINYPVTSRKSIESIFSSGDQELYNPDDLSPNDDAGDVLSEEENREVASGREVGRLSARVAKQFTKASILIAGIMGVKQDLREAECGLLTILRKLGYLCDIELLDKMELSEKGANSTHYRSRFHRGICKEHRLELDDLLSNPFRPRISCPTWLQMKRKGATESNTVPVPRAKKNYETLQQTLTLLSYFYLLENQKYELVAAYASLSIYLSAAAHKIAYDDLRPKVLQHLKELSLLRRQASDERRPNTQSGSRQPDSNKLHRRLKNWGEIKLARIVGTKLPYDAFKSNSPPLALVNSPVVSIGQQMTLLAVCALLDPAAKLRDMTWLPSFETLERPIQISASMWHVNHLFSHVFRVPFSRAPHEVAFLLLLTAMNQWKGIQHGMNTLDQSYRSVHAIDSFVLMTWLLKDCKDDLCVHNSREKGKSLDESSLLKELSRLALTQYRSLVGRGRKFLPLPDDTIRFYSRRLLSFSAANIRGGESAEAMLFSGLAAPVHRPDAFAARRYAFQLLRTAKQRDLDRARVIPLLYASDIDAYLSAANWTVLERLGDGLANAFLFLFTETTAEGLLRRMGVEMLSPALTGGEGLSLDESPARFVGAFLDAFAGSRGLRRLSVATWLLAAALESGEATGFALVFHEAGERRNGGLAAFADYLARGVWDDDARARTWCEHHAGAQWHREKPPVRGYGAAFSLDGHAPFRYSASESRQEIVAYIDRWRAARLVRDAMTAANRPDAGRRLHQAKSILLRCTSHILWSVALGGSGNPGYEQDATAATRGEDGPKCADHDEMAWLERIPSTLYDGMLFPAGDPQCALQLYSLLEHMYGTCFTERMKRNFMTYVLGDLVSRLAYYYNFTENLSSKDVLPPARIILEDDDLSHKNQLKRGKSNMHGNDDGGKYGSDMEREFLVEPWNRIGVKLGEEMPISVGRGEGMLYNLRLHRLSGLWWSAKTMSLWNHLKNWFRWST